MRTDTTHYTGAINNVLLPGTILLANVDVTGLFEYALKAAAGGAVWLAFKMAGEYFERRRKQQEIKARTNRIRSRKFKKNENGYPE
ncbi:hypothetical protein ACE38W_00875 [Chitinophaga sp. Hz27]|uniref:hypothetical protein n=1 Tax=Chitinophaga sp. Hz27 TaxID=3347169 RepID=UPI0035DA4DCC